MSDAGLFWDSEASAADVALAQNDMAADEGLETAVLLSLFTRRRAEPGDVLPEGEQERGGWWGDGVPDVDGDRMGSRLWLLSRAKETPTTLALAEQYAREALAWLVEDRVAESVSASAVLVRRGVLGLTVTVRRPGQREAVRYRYDYVWASQEARRRG